MQVKEIYLDLKEGEQYAKRNNNVWTLTSEAFKDPLKIKLVYDNEDKKLLEKYVEDCKNYKALELKERELDKKIKEQQHIIEEISRIRDNENELLWKAKELISNNKDLKSNVTDLQNVNNENFIILLNKINKIKDEIDKNPQKKIYRYHGEDIINWFDTYYWDIEIPTWKYITIEAYTFHPQNEFVLNEDITLYKTICVEWSYTPATQLMWSNAIDKPTALVELDILFFQV